MSQRIQEPNQEVDVKISLPETTLNVSANLDSLPIITTNQNSQTNVLPFNVIAKHEISKGYYRIPHIDGQLTVTVYAEINPKLGNQYQIIKKLKKN